MFSAFQSNAFQNNAFQIVVSNEVRLSGVPLKKRKIDRRIDEKWIARAYRKRQEQEQAEQIAANELKQNSAIIETKEVDKPSYKSAIEFDDTFITNIEDKVNQLTTAVNKIKFEKRQRLNKIRLLLLLTH
jgi:hypothetical protein